MFRRWYYIIIINNLGCENLYLRFQMMRAVTYYVKTRYIKYERGNRPVVAAFLTTVMAVVVSSSSSSLRRHRRCVKERENQTRGQGNKKYNIILWYDIILFCIQTYELLAKRKGENIYLHTREILYYIIYIIQGDLIYFMYRIVVFAIRIPNIPITLYIYRVRTL